MKRLVLILVLVSISIAANAQFKIGGGLAFGFDIEKPGITINGDYKVNDNWHVSPSFTFFFRNTVSVNTGFGSVETSSGLATFNADAHYILDTPDLKNIVLYPIGGLNFAFSSVESSSTIPGVVDTSTSVTDVGLNLGFGAEFSLSDVLDAYSELKFVVGDASQGVINLGILYRL